MMNPRGLLSLKATFLLFFLVLLLLESLFTGVNSHTSISHRSGNKNKADGLFPLVPNPDFLQVLVEKVAPPHTAIQQRMCRIS